MHSLEVRAENLPENLFWFPVSPVNLYWNSRFDKLIIANAPIPRKGSSSTTATTLFAAKLSIQSKILIKVEKY